MPKIKSRATVGPDGMVHLDLSVGAEHAGEEVEVTVEPTRGMGDRRRSSVQYPPGWDEMTQEEYEKRVLDLAGSIDDPTFDPRPIEPPAASAVRYPVGYRKMTPEEWRQFIEETAGSIDDPTFVRPPALPLRDRGPMFD